MCSILRIVHSQEHFAAVLVRKKDTAKKTEALVIDGPFLTEIKDAAAALVTHLLEVWFQHRGTMPKIEVARCPGQRDSWSCGHRVVAAFEGLVAQGFLSRDLEGKFPLPLKKVTLGLEALESLGESQPAAAETTPRRKKPRTAAADMDLDRMSPPALPGPSRQQPDTQKCPIRFLDDDGSDQNDAASSQTTAKGPGPWGQHDSDLESRCCGVKWCIYTPPGCILLHTFTAFTYVH